MHLWEQIPKKMTTTQSGLKARMDWGYYNLEPKDWIEFKLQALFYHVLPSTTAVFSYAIGSRKLSVNEQFLVGAHTVVSLLQTTQIMSDICFITDHVAYASSNKNWVIWIETELSFYPGWICLMFNYMHAWALGGFYSHTGTQTFQRALTVSVDSCAEIKSATSVAWPILAEFGRRCWKAKLGVWIELLHTPKRLKLLKDWAWGYYNLEPKDWTELLHTPKRLKLLNSKNQTSPYSTLH